jgi:NADPH:quinone reductase-like Zn-dependent oxidoreductase
VRFSRFGDPDVLEVAEVDVPAPAAGQVRVRVGAAGVNPVDVKIRGGAFAGASPVFPRGLGIDAAGVVDAVGEGVDDVSVGDVVVGVTTGGGYAEVALLKQWARVPDGLSLELAASLPTPGEAAFRALKQLGVVAGETLLVHGAAGSVGSIATQLAVRRGVHVVGTVAEADDDYLRSLGAVPVRYGPGLVDRVRAAAPNGVDAALDTAGRGALPDSVELTGGTDRVITLADPEAGTYGVRFSSGGPGEAATEALAELVGPFARGELTLRLARSFPLEEAAQAHRLLEGGQAGGKLLLVPVPA